MNNPFKNPKVKVVTEWVVLFLAACAAVFAFWLILMEFRSLSLAGPEPGYRMRYISGAESLQPLTPSEIRGWMTFRYLNLAFKLPPDYLRSQLDITDSHYPNMSINFLAKEQKQPAAEVLSAVAAAIKNYQPPVSQ